MQYQSSIFISAPAEKIFLTYSDISGWSSWDEEVEYSSLTGQFEKGAKGKIKPKGAPESKFTLIEVTENKSFTVECILPLCKMRFVHLLETKENGTNVINQVKFNGFLAPLFGRIIGKSIAKTLPDSLSGLKRNTESKS